MNYLQQSRRLFVSLTLLLVLTLPALFAEATSLGLSRYQVRLDDVRIDDKIQLNIQTQQPEGFTINISALGAAAASPDEFILKPELTNTSGYIGEEGNVIVAMDLPYRDQSTNGLNSRASINRVKNNQPQTATNEFSLCNESGKVCKPLTIQVQDDSTAIPGTVYSTVITIQATDDNGLSKQQRLVLKYRKDGDLLRIKKFKDKLNLHSGNNYADSVNLCVSSPVYNRFNISFENKRHHQFVLKGKNTQEILPYNVSFARKENPNDFTPVSPKQWFSGGQPVRLKKDADCSISESNIQVLVVIDNDDINRSIADTYKGALMIRVKAL